MVVTTVAIITFGGSVPRATLRLNNHYLHWSSKVKYLGLYLIGGVNLRINLNMAKHKYFGCFNNIKSIVEKQMNEIMILKLIKTYCLHVCCMAVRCGPLNQ